MYRKQLRSILSLALRELEHNGDFELKTNRDVVAKFLANRIAESDFMQNVHNGPGDKIEGKGWAQG